MRIHYKKSANRLLGLLLGIGALVASASYGQEPRDATRAATWLWLCPA